MEQAGALLRRMKWPTCALPSKVTNLLSPPACTGRSLDQRVQIFPYSKVYFNLVLCLILSTEIYNLFWSYNTGQAS